MKKDKGPDIGDPKYKYFHKKTGKIFIDNERYFRDVKKWKEQQAKLTSQPPQDER